MGFRAGLGDTWGRCSEFFFYVVFSWYVGLGGLCLSIDLTGDGMLLATIFLLVFVFYCHNCWNV